MQYSYSSLDRKALVRASGADAASFLQGQFGNDVAALDGNHYQLNCYANPKGRLLSVFRIYQAGDDYYLCMPDDIIDATVQRLKMFVLMAKVNFEVLRDSWAVLGVWGEDSEQALAGSLGGELPANAGEKTQMDACRVLRIDDDVPRFEIHGPLEDINALAAKLGAAGNRLDQEQWQLREILCGTPTVYTQTREEFVPQMANLDLVGGLSFKKGCYPGQEIVARMHYLGNLKRRMYLLNMAGNTLPLPGDALISASTSANAGKVVDAARSEDGRIYLLAVLTIKDAESGGMQLASDANAELAIESLPYSLEKAS